MVDGVLAALLLALGLSQASPPGDSGLLLRAVRFYRTAPGQALGQTQVTAMLRVPADLAASGPSGDVVLQFAVRVLSDTGTLYQQTWHKRTTLPFPRGDADRLEVLRFSLVEGRFRLEASVVDSVSGRRAEVDVPVEAYPTAPAASDLLLSAWVRPVAAADTIPAPGEFRRGGLILAIAPDVVVGGATASVAYLLETYSGTAVQGSLRVAITDPSGAVLRRNEATPVRVTAGIGLLTGQIDVGDLPPGRFRLVTTLDLGGRTVTRDAEFAIDPAAGAAPAALSDRDYFGGMTGADLDRAFAPLEVIAEPGELAGWPPTGTDAEKRAVLIGIWGRRDPTAATGNERRAQFYDGVAYADVFFGEPRSRLAGWQTDRGRVFLREGLAPQVLRREQRGRVPAYEVWRYFEGAGRYYIFAARGTLGSFRLIRSDDPQAPGEPGWQQILTPIGVREIVAFLGRAVLDR